MKIYISAFFIFAFSICILGQVVDSVILLKPAKTPTPINKSEDLPVDRDKYGKVITIITKEGDSAYSISDGYGLMLTELEKFNKLAPGEKLAIGTEIKIPVTEKVFERLVRADQIILDAGILFKQGLFDIQERRTATAGGDFDKSVEVFLMSGINVSRNAKLQSCYSQLIETVYRIEFPTSTQTPQIRGLLATCSWSIDNDLADKVARLVLTPPIETNSVASVSTVGGTVVQTTPPQGFYEQRFEPSPLDDLAKLAPEEKKTVLPKYSRPQLQLPTTIPKTVKAKTGDTVATLASREGISAVELAKYNGLLPTSTLSAGREIKIPGEYVTVKPVLQKVSTVGYATNKSGGIGAKPTQTKDGKVQAVLNYIDDTFNDPYSVRFVKWSAIEKGYDAWKVTVRLRAKNSFNAYILSEVTFYIRNNKVIDTIKLF